MEQIGRVLRLQAVAGAGDQSLGLIAGDLNHLDGQAGQRLLQGRCPGGAVTLRLVGFQEQEIGLGFDGYQAGWLPWKFSSRQAVMFLGGMLVARCCVCSSA